MVEILLMDWLEEFNSLSESEIRSYASEQQHNNEIIIALCTVFDEHIKFSHLVDPVCNQLFYFYRSGEDNLQRFTLQFIPSLVLLYLENVTHGERQIYRSVETLLIGVYNLEIMDKSGQPKVISFRIPSIAQASIYHESATLNPAFLTENCLRRWEECNSKLVNWGPLPQVEYLNAQNRLRVMTALIFCFNRQLGQLSQTSLEHFCKASSKLVTQGFHTSGPHVRLSVDSDSSHCANFTPRIALSSQLLLEILHAVHYAVFSAGVANASQTLDDVLARATYESFVDVILVANAVKNLVNISRSGISDGIMNMNVVQSSTTIASVSKSMITNASFRTKKLPDDIPIQLDREENENAGLDSITEEKEDEDKATLKSSFKTSKENSSALSSVKNLPKTFSGLGKKVKETKAGLKFSNQEKDRGDAVRKSVELEKETKLANEIEFNNLGITDKEKVSLVSDSLEKSDGSATNLDSFAEKSLQNNAVHVSSV